ncbi:MAG: ABC transporter substrate-binding protein [Acetobacteraceae bacterium]|nr:ABC transporter substrate-binding protein [Acetobacteraceae bacterium]
MNTEKGASVRQKRNDLTRRNAMVSAASLAGLRWGHAAAETQNLKIGVVSDMSGPYQSLGGPTSVACVRQAVQDFAGPRGIAVEVVTADHQAKPDVGAAIVRQWFDRDGVDVVVDSLGTAVGLAVQGVARQKNKVFLITACTSTIFTNEQCSPNGIQWAYDTYLLAVSTGGATVRAGGKKWFIIFADYQFGHQLRDDATAIVQANGGVVLGAVAHPYPGATDFSAMLMQARASGADVIAFANSGTDTVNAIKQAREFALHRLMKIVVLQMFIPDVHALGLEVADGLNLTETFYWDLNAGTRAFSARLAAKVPGVRACSLQASAYSATLHWLNTAHDMGIANAKADGRAVVARMKAVPSDDDCFGVCQIRADGRRLMPAYLFQVKTPDESSGPWDYYKLMATTPAEQAAHTLAESRCPLIRADGSMGSS